MSPNSSMIMMASTTLPLHSMPPEIWLTILTHLSEADFLSLKHASTHLRRIITSNASTICNALITKHYAPEAAILQTTFRDGWLVPTLPAITREERQLARYTRSRSSSLHRSSRCRSRDPSPSPSPPATVQGPYAIQDAAAAAAAVMRTNLSTPGPHYLRFLIEYSFEIRVANAMFIDVAARGKSGSGGSSGETPQEKLDRWIGLYTVRRFLMRLQKIADGSGGGAGGSFSSFGSDAGGGVGGRGSGEQDAAMVRATREGLAWFYE